MHHGFLSVSHHGYQTQAPVVHPGRCWGLDREDRRIKPSRTYRSETMHCYWKVDLLPAFFGFSGSQRPSTCLFTYKPPFAASFMFFACKCQMFILPSNQREEGGVGSGEGWQRACKLGSHFPRKVEWWV